MSRRIRTLKPELLEDEKVAPLSDSAWRLFVSLITLADDYGNVRADVRWLQGQVWWAHAEPPNVLSALVELVKASLIEPYGVRGGAYCHIRGWEKHQRIDNAGKNKVPMHNDADALRIDVDRAEDWKLSPRVAASRREPGSQDPSSPLDQDRNRKGEERECPRPEPGDVALASDLWSAILRNFPAHALSRVTPAEKTKRLAKWADHVRLMRTVDRHTPDEIAALIRWCQADSFWKANIQSTEKLREQWDKLVAQMAREGKAPTATQRKTEQPAFTFNIGGVEVER